MPAVQIKSPLSNEQDLQDLLKGHPAFSDPRVFLNVATVTLTADRHAGRDLLFDRAAGVTAVLPAAKGTGDKYLFKIKTTATSNSIIVKVANATDIIQGLIVALSDGSNAVLAWEAGATADTITFDRTTTGTAKVGHWIELQDTAPGLWTVRGDIAQSGTEATPFSATVS